MLGPAQRRHAIGIIALLLLGTGAIAWLAMEPTPTALDLQAACWRIGPLLAAVWLAYEELKRVPAWLWLALPVLVIVVARWPRTIWLLVPLLVAVAILKPRPRRNR